jgi:hypothetical protein
MSVVPMPGSAPPPVPDTQTAYDALLPRLAHTADLLAGKAAMASSAAEAKDFADGALKMAQAIITLDPERLAGGDTPDARKRSMPTPPDAAGKTRPATGDGDHDGRVGE